MAEAVRERPMPFRVSMVQGIRRRLKRKTRRVVEVKGLEVDDYELGWRTDLECGPTFAAWNDLAGRDGYFDITCPHGKVGDRLWVREPWRASLAYELTKPSDIPPGSPLLYEAGGGTLPEWNSGKYRPGMFLPRWGSRITLEITEVGVERLADISPEEAIAEGIEGRGVGWALYNDPAAYTSDPVFSFRTLWESINGPGSWDANPWVWVIGFREVEA